MPTGLVETFCDRLHPSLSAQFVVDESHEAAVMVPVQKAFERIGKTARFFVANLHDGVDLPPQGHSELVAIAQAAAPGIRFAVKPYPDAIEFARQKHPGEDWSMVSVIPATLFIESCRKARQLGEKNYRENSLVYRNIVEGRIYSRVVLVDGDAEYFDGSMWRRLSSLHALARRELEEALARPVSFDTDAPGKRRFTLDILHPPLTDGEFIGRVQSELHKFARPASLSPLDADNEMMLLGDNGIVLNFNNGRCVPNTAEL